MKFSATISFVFSVFGTLQGANAGVTLVLPIPTSIQSVSIPSISLPSGFSIPSLSIPTLSIPSISLPSGFSIPSLSIPTPSAPTASLSTPSVTAIETVSVGGVGSSDGATTYVLQNIEGVNGVTTTVGLTFAQGATVWRDDDLHETCSLDGRGGAVCVEERISGFATSFTGSALPIFTVGANAGGAGGFGGGSGGGNSGGSSPSGGGAARTNGGASVAWMLNVFDVALRIFEGSNSAITEDPQEALDALSHTKVFEMDDGSGGEEDEAGSGTDADGVDREGSNF
ncbi:hypothetical protein B0H19DRAFT_1086202 [Mycena capillaripes]|nr:hypothetical protein B0H19DRAFT_1086202 [Mycena capillaripes]